jgi:hypothetical protein
MITNAGSGPAKSPTKSNSSRPPMRSSSQALSASTFGRSAWIERTLNTRLARRRRRVCSGGSRNTIHKVSMRISSPMRAASAPGSEAKNGRSRSEDHTPVSRQTRFTSS